MWKALRVLCLVAAVLGLVVGITIFVLYRASKQEPAFYREAVQLDPADQEQARDEFVAQAAALASDVRRSGHWQSLFTDDQINAWLSLELASHYPGLLSGELHAPRIAIADKQATIACRYETGGVSTVLSLSVDVYVQQPNVLAVRIVRARAGALPVPLSQILDAISNAARALELRLEWAKSHGDPVALISFTQPRGMESKSIELEQVELRDRELFVSGTMNGQNHQVDLPTAATEARRDQPLLGSAVKDARQE